MTGALGSIFSTTKGGQFRKGTPYIHSYFLPVKDVKVSLPN
jgi:hypothetical protein